MGKAGLERGENGERGLVGEGIGPRISRMDTDGFLDGRGLWCGGLVLGWETSLNGAGPAGWLRESGSRLPHSKAFGGGAGWERGW